MENPTRQLNCALTSMITCVPAFLLLTAPQRPLSEHRRKRSAMADNRRGFCCAPLCVVLLATSLLLIQVGRCNQALADDKQALLQDRDYQQQQLGELKRNITKVEAWLRKAEKQQSALTKKLKTTELNISENLRQRRIIEAEIKSARETIADLKDKEAAQQHALQQQQGLLKQQLLAAHAMGHEQGIKLLFNAEDPVNLQRFLKYYEYVNSARTEKIEQSRLLIAKLQQTQSEIRSSNQKLIDSITKLTKNQQALQAEKNKRAHALSALANRLADRQDELGQLEVDQQQLENLIEQIELDIASIAPPSGAAAFAMLQGQLTWPTDGALTGSFGASNNSLAHSTGIFFKTDNSQSVKAIYHGRVIFADWLRGFGLLLIVDHGDDYMSLYGFNQSLLKETGDWVTSNEVIATTGNSGGQSQTGLYFEIRHKGKPSNPLSWLIKEPTRP